MMDKKFSFENSEKYGQLPDTSTTGLSKQDIFSSDDSIHQLLKNIQENQIKIFEKLNTSSGINGSLCHKVYYGSIGTTYGYDCPAENDIDTTLNFGVDSILDSVVSSIQLSNDPSMASIIIPRAYGVYGLSGGTINPWEMICISDVDILLSTDKTISLYPNIVDSIRIKLKSRRDCRLRNILLYSITFI